LQEAAPAAAATAADAARILEMKVMVKRQLQAELRQKLDVAVARVEDLEATQSTRDEEVEALRSVCSRAAAALQRMQSECKAAEVDKRTAQETAITLHHSVRVLTRELKNSRAEAALQASAAAAAHDESTALLTAQVCSPLVFPLGPRAMCAFKRLAPGLRSATERRDIDALRACVCVQIQCMHTTYNELARRFQTEETLPFFPAASGSPRRGKPCELDAVSGEEAASSSPGRRAREHGGDSAHSEPAAKRRRSHALASPVGSVQLRDRDAGVCCGSLSTSLLPELEEAAVDVMDGGDEASTQPWEEPMMAEVREEDFGGETAGPEEEEAEGASDVERKARGAKRVVLSDDDSAEEEDQAEEVGASDGAAEAEAETTARIDDSLRLRIATASYSPPPSDLKGAPLPLPVTVEAEDPMGALAAVAEEEAEEARRRDEELMEIVLKALQDATGHRRFPAQFAAEGVQWLRNAGPTPSL
jgi:hypothetical protein